MSTYAKLGDRKKYQQTAQDAMRASALAGAERRGADASNTSPTRATSPARTLIETALYSDRDHMEDAIRMMSVSAMPSFTRSSAVFLSPGGRSADAHASSERNPATDAAAAMRSSIRSIKLRRLADQRAKNRWVYLYEASQGMA